jgi:hypothetical protein
MALSSSNVDAVSLASKWNPSREKTFKNIIESLPGNYKSQLEGIFTFMTDEPVKFLTCSLASRERIPKVLFRAFNAKSGGGHPTLNTEKGIVPHTYVHETAARRN